MGRHQYLALLMLKVQVLSGLQSLHHDLEVLALLAPPLDGHQFRDRCQIPVDVLGTGARTSLSPAMGVVRCSWATFTSLSTFVLLDLFFSDAWVPVLWPWLTLKPPDTIEIAKTN